MNIFNYKFGPLFLGASLIYDRPSLSHYLTRSLVLTFFYVIFLSVRHSVFEFFYLSSIFYLFVGLFPFFTNDFAPMDSLSFFSQFFEGFDPDPVKLRPDPHFGWKMNSRLRFHGSKQNWFLFFILQVFLSFLHETNILKLPILGIVHHEF